MALTPEQQAMDFNPELQDVSRQRKLAELLMAQGMQQPQGQMISGQYVAPSFAQQLNPIANILAGQAVGERADTKQVQMAEMLRKKQAAQIEQYGQLEQTDKAKALRFALGSDNPTLREIAKEELKGIKLGKGDIFTRTSLGGATTKLEGSPDLPDSIQYAISVGQLPANPATWSPQQANYAKQLVESKGSASANRQFLNLTNQLPFQEQIQQEMGKDLIKEFSNLKSIPSQVQNLDKIEKLSASPAYLGSGAEVKLAITKLFNNNLGTNVNADKVSNTEEMRSALFQSTMENLKKVDAQPSQMQQQIMQQAFGTIGTDPAAIPKIVAVYKDILISKANEHNARVKQSEEGPAKIKYAYDITVKVPETAKPPATGALSNINYGKLDDLLKARGASK
jgi:hypothetical protein